MTSRHHPDRQELDDWALYGPKNSEISELVDRLAFDYGLRVHEIEDVILRALTKRLAEEDAHHKGMADG